MISFSFGEQKFVFCLFLQVRNWQYNCLIIAGWTWIANCLHFLLRQFLILDHCFAKNQLTARSKVVVQEIKHLLLVFKEADRSIGDNDLKLFLFEG